MNQMLVWIGAALAIGIIIKVISDLSDAKPENLTWSKSTAKAVHHTEPAPRRFDDNTTKSTPKFNAKQKKSDPPRPASTFPNKVGSGGRFPIPSLRGYKITLYVVHFIVYFFSSIFFGGVFFFIAYLVYKLTTYYNKNAYLEQLSPTQQLDFIDYAKSITGNGYFLKVVVPVFILSGALRVIIVFLLVTLFSNSDLLQIIQQFH